MSSITRTSPRNIEIANPFSGGTYRVWQRNRDAFLRLWKTELWPPFVEALLTLFAFGFGLGAYVQGQIEGLTYLQFIAPGLIMTSVLFTASFECMFGTYIRMEYQKLFNAIVATPISLSEVVSGEIMWAASRATFTAVCVLIVLTVFGLVLSWLALAIIPLAFVAGFMFASLAMIVTGLVPAINSYNYYITLGVIPMQLFSGVFFPVSRLPANFGWLVNVSPLYPVVKLARELFTGRVGVDSLGYGIWILALTAISYYIAIALMHRRLIK